MSKHKDGDMPIPTPQWAKELARSIHLAETRANGALLEGGYGFLSPSSREPYERIAVETIERLTSAAILTPSTVKTEGE